MVHSHTVPSVDFWLDCSIAASVERLRVLLPALADGAGYAVREVESITTGPGWAMFALDVVGGPRGIATARAQDVGDGRAQMFVGPGPARDQAALDHLNRAALHLYCRLIERGLLAPPPPFEVPRPPLVPPEA